MFANVVLLFASLLGLMRPQYPDPSRMRFDSRDGRMAVITPMTCAAREGMKEFTWTIWLKTDAKDYRKEDLANDKYSGYPNVAGFFSTFPALSTQEGGPALTDLVGYDEPLALVGGKWTKAVLKAAYDDGGYGGTDYQHGVYCVNIKTDRPLTLTVGGYTTNILASAAKQVFNVRCETESRAVTVIASDASAVVHLGIAENPMVQFHGGNLVVLDSHMSATKFRGIVPDEYTFIVQRARINGDGTISTQLGALLCDGEYWTDTETVTPKRARSTFADNARISAKLFAFGGIGTNASLHVYGGVVYDRWVPDSVIRSIRDQDVAKMQCRGVEFPRLASNYWALVYSPQVTSETTELITGGEDPVSHAVSEYHERTVRTTKAAVMDVVPGVNSVDRFPISEIGLSCAAATAIVENVVYFRDAGAYDVYGRDPVGNVKSCRVTISAPADVRSEVQRYTGDGDGWQRTCNESVVAALMSAESDGVVRTARAWSSDFTYQRVRARRLHCLPTASTAGTSFDKAVQAVSPHVFTTAWHYGYVHGGRVTYTAPDGSESTACVEGGDFYHGAITSTVSLAAWARGHGFSAAEVAAANIGDVAVGVFTNGSVDASCCPWFMSPSTASNHFYTARLLAWAATQTDMGYGVPVSVRPNGTNGFDFCEWLTANTIDAWPTQGAVKPIGSSGGDALYDLGDLTSLEALTRIRERGKTMPNAAWMFPRTYPGDSGGGVYLDLGGRLVRVAHGHRAGFGFANGPSYVKGFRILKAFVESVGDALKVIDE